MPNRCGGADPSSATDEELLSRTRSGDDTAFEEFYRRHADTLLSYARSCSQDPHTAQDLTAGAFEALLQQLRRGGGPRSSAHGYLRTTVRRAAARRTDAARREAPSEDVTAHLSQPVRQRAATAPSPLPGGAAQGPQAENSADADMLRRTEHSLAAEAFRALPLRARTALWHTAVEELPLNSLASELSMTENAAAVLTHRARKKLRRAYLQAHISQSLAEDRDCQWYANQLGAYAYGALPGRVHREMERHLASCARCSAACAELGDICVPGRRSGGAARVEEERRAWPVALTKHGERIAPASLPVRNLPTGYLR